MSDVRDITTTISVLLNRLDAEIEMFNKHLKALEEALARAERAQVDVEASVAGFVGQFKERR